MQSLLYFQALILGGGVFFSWTKLIGQFTYFYDMYGTIFKIRDCIIPNPMVTACFYGSIALLVAFIWSVTLIQSYSHKSQKYLSYLLYFGVVFALSVIAYEFLEYYHIISLGGNAVSCSPGTFPLKTPCFYGMLFFLGASIAARTILKEDTD